MIEWPGPGRVCVKSARNSTKHSEKSPGDAGNRPDDETGESALHSPMRTLARLASGQAPSSRRHGPGVNRSRPADPRREGSRPRRGSAKTVRSHAGAWDRGVGAEFNCRPCDQGGWVVQFVLSGRLRLSPEMQMAREAGSRAISNCDLDQINSAIGLPPSIMTVGRPTGSL